VSDSREREDLEALLSAPGWLRLLQYAKETWAGDGYAQKLKLAIKDATTRGENVAEAVQRVDAANEEVNAVLSWPRQRVQQLTQHETARTQAAQPSLSRRGVL